MCDVTASATKCTRPKWGVLYALVGVALALFGVVDILSPPGGWRALMDGLAAVVLCGAMAAWVRANRRALAQVDWCACTAEKTIVRVFHPQPRARPVAQPVKGVPLRVHQVALGEADSGQEKEAECSVTSDLP